MLNSNKHAMVPLVLSVAKLTPGQESYYERSVAAGLDDYYAGRGESPGVWIGRGAAVLGLEGVVHDGQLGTLIRGLDPASGKRLRSHPKERTITIERIDPHAGERRLEQKKLSPVAGFDLVFSVPKSISLLHALGDEETRRAVGEAPLASWQAALASLEDEACVPRRGKNGVLRENAGGFVAAAYQHRTSRAQDPHLHTHVIVANMAQSPSDEKWRARDGGAILKTHPLGGGHPYEGQLRGGGSRPPGVGGEEAGKGGGGNPGGPPAGAGGALALAGRGVERAREGLGRHPWRPVGGAGRILHTAPSGRRRDEREQQQRLLRGPGRGGRHA